jgi:HEAT repeat protein
MSTTELLHALAADLDALASEDPYRRQDARAHLQRVGTPARDALLAALETRDERTRYEVLKVLGALGEPAAVEAFVRSLEDESSDCRWVAAEALIALGPVGLRRILVELVRYPETERMLRGAHHVLSGLRRAGHVETTAPVLRAFASDIPEIDLPKAAIHELTWMRV